ncbi:MAG: universal stress protein [Gemmataceae bacterium]|nr:universal stress protein [Gemmataceae bacterium]
MIRNILVPLDGSDFGEQALDWATLVAKRAGARVHLVHVREPLIVADPLFQQTLVDVETQEEAQEYLDALLHRLADPEIRSATRTAVLEGAVGESLRQYALSHHIDLVVMTTHGRGPWAKFWEGSIAETLVRTLPASILLIRANEQVGGSERFGRKSGFRHILMPTPTETPPLDQSGAAWEIARLFGSRVTMLHVRPSGSQEMAAASIGQPTTSAGVPPHRSEPGETPDDSRIQLGERPSEPSVAVDRHVVEHDVPAEAILAEAHRLGCDLIAMETRCRTGLSRLVKGSTADWIVRHASAPVLLHCARSHGEKQAGAASG